MDLAADHTREWLIGTAVVGIALIAWFLVVWLALGRRVWDAAGESIGSGLLLLLIVTLVGAVRRRRRDGD
jgi:MYXO-CTERM domain-containing protein